MRQKRGRSHGETYPGPPDADEGDQYEAPEEPPADPGGGDREGSEDHPRRVDRQPDS